MNYANKHALVLGLGESGLAMARWLVYRGARVRVADTRGEQAVAERLATLRAAAAHAAFVGGQAFTAGLLDGVDFVAVSPGLVPERDLAVLSVAAAEKNIPLWGEMELFAQALTALREERAYAPKVLGITGTNGKTTVTSLTGMLCRRAGLTTGVAGNISPAALDVLRAALIEEQAYAEAPSQDARVCSGGLPQAWVLELSSFQLHMTYSLQADAAAVLNITQDHLDWHGSMAAYIADKARIFGDKTVRVLNRSDAVVMKMATSGATVSSFGLDEPVKAGDFGLVAENGMSWLTTTMLLEDEDPPEGRRRRKSAKETPEPACLLKRLMPADALRIHGLHNALNAMAALALCRAAGLPLAGLLHGLRDYTGEPHRVELVATIGDVAYYDDSKGTNVGATVAALNGFGQGGKPNRLLLIAGGDGKGQDFSPLAEPLTKYGRAVFLIGRDAGAIRAAVADTGIALIDCATLEAAVEQAAGMAQGGDVVLLSPACASLDMFRNYAHRAEVFIDAVREVALSHGEVVE